MPAGNADNMGNLRITDEDLEKLKRRIGVQQSAEASFTKMTADVLRRFATYCLATDNPLYTDEAYGRSSPFGSMIAAPVTGYLTLSAGRGGMGLPGIFALHASDEWIFQQPILPGDDIRAERCLKSIEEKPSKWGGRAIHQVHEHNIRNQRQELVTTYRSLMVRAERTKARESGKYKQIEPYRYSPEELEAIGRDLDAETVRGATPRYWEDVQEGDSLGHVVKGPFTVSDIICMWMGAGAPLMFPFRLRHLQFKKRPGLAIVDPATNVAHSPEIAHFDAEYAKRSGLGAPYDTGRQRTCWYAHLVTNWMGDHAWLKELRARFLTPNYVGDTTWVKGKVVAKYQDQGENLVRCEMESRTQRGHLHSTGEAIVRLESRSGAGKI